MENSMEVPPKLAIELPYKPMIPLLGTHPEKTLVREDTCIPMLVAALSTTVETWKQSKRPWTGE